MIPSFEEFASEEVDIIASAFERYAIHVADIEKGGSPTPIATKTVFSVEDLHRESSNTGLPNVPKLNNETGETTKLQKKMIRLYVSALYGLFIN